MPSARRTRPATAAATLLAGLALTPAAHAEDRFIVRLDAERPAAATSTRVARATGARIALRLRHGFAARLTAAQVRAARADPAVVEVVRDARTHAAAVPLLAGGSIPVGVRRIGAATATFTSPPATGAVAVIDTGVQLDHPDLDVADGTDCVDPGTPAGDQNGHGTHVAGTIAARDDGAGVLGVAPGTRVLAVRVLDANGQGYISQLICGLAWVTAHAAALDVHTANLSIGAETGPSTSCDDDELRAAICRASAAGVAVVVAAGNDHVEIHGAARQVPADYPEVLTVSAMTDTDGRPGAAGGAACDELDDVIADFSNFTDDPGTAAHMIAAPGACVSSTRLGGGTTVMSGTSMATPHVTGALALCFGAGGRDGPCAGMAPAQAIARVRALAAAHATTANGFLGDPLRPVEGESYGPLLYAPLTPALSAGAVDAVDARSATVRATVTRFGEPVGYRVEYGPTTAYGQTTAEAALAGGDGPADVAVPLAGLSPRTAYHYRVVARGSGGTAASADLVLTTAPAPAPAAPTALVAAARGSRAISASWQAAADAEDYVLTARDLAGGPDLTRATAATSALIAGLTAGHRYLVSVRARNPSGDGPESAALTVALPEGDASSDGGPGGARGKTVVALGSPKAQLRLTGARIQSLGRGTVRIQVACPANGCAARVTGRLLLPGNRTLGLGPRARRLRATARPVTLTLRLGPWARELVRGALRAGKPVRVRLRVVATDPSGRRVTRTWVVRAA